jgi:hypothetical protein
MTGRAFYDGWHCGGNYNANNRSKPGEEQVTIWELHPVMKLDVVK